jgi:hypothetical protein
MQKKRNTTVDERLEAAYQKMAQDETHEAEALAWAEGLIGDVADEDRPLSRDNP